MINNQKLKSQFDPDSDKYLLVGDNIDKTGASCTVIPECFIVNKIAIWDTPGKILFNIF